jgi:hypothetical protein
MYDGIKLNITDLCPYEDFKNNLLKGITDFENNLLVSYTNQYKNKEILPTKLNNADNIVKSLLNLSPDNLYSKDIRNPISFTNFIIRTPRINGRNRIINPSNSSSYNYIRPGSLINILFIKEQYKELNNVKVSISAYLVRKSQDIVPVNINGFYEVDLDSNKDNYKSNLGKQEASNTPNRLGYNYTIKPYKNYPIQSEINTESLNTQPGEKLIVTIKNVDDNYASFTTTFEFEDYGWTTQAGGGFSWVNTVNSGSKDYVAAGSSSLNFYFKPNKGSYFLFDNFFNPSFGPELIVLQDKDQKTLVGLGGSISTFMKSVKFGYGWYLTGNNGNPYFSIGVNFIEGYQAISSILNNIKDK